MGELSVGVDVGGTFTDILLHDSETGEINVVKVPSTPNNPGVAILEAMAGFKEQALKFQLISHATTIATNALLTHKGLASTVLITNHGFRDVLEIARQRRPELYNLYTRRPTPIVKRMNRYTVRCRMLADGREAEPLDLKEAEHIARRIVRERFASVAISFINSYVNPKHEIVMARILEHANFRGHVSLSSDVNREYREYERTSTTVVNATLSPLMSNYLSEFRKMLDKEGFSAPVYMMNSDGGMSTLSFASKYPISVIESGPAAGVLASKHLANMLSLDKVLTFDMGGTTAKAGTVLNGEPDISYEFEAGGRSHSGRSIKGSGYAVRTPFIDLAEVSSGGGTIARVDEGGALRVGPDSAGSEPGPAAYGRGGKQPTVTDANVLLGRVNPRYLLGGKMPIHFELAQEAIEDVAAKMNLSARRMAEGIIRLVNNNMAKAISIVSVERGRDPREFCLIAFGGAGPIHSCDLADELQIGRIVVPLHAGLFSAYGLLTADLTRMFTLPVLSTTASLESYFARLVKLAEKELKKEGLSGYSFRGYAEMRYKGQSYELVVPYSKSADMKALFAAKHKAVYGYSSSDPVETVNIKMRAGVPTARVRGSAVKLEAAEVPASTVRRQVWFGTGYETASVYRREQMKVGSRGRGPSVIEEYDSTLVVNPGWRWSLQEYGTELSR